MTMTNSTTFLRCGTWPSPLTAEAAAASAVSLAFAGAAGQTLYWIEGRPAERGRSVLVARRPSGEIEDVSGPQSNVRTQVHEYGGVPWVALGDRLVYPEYGDQQLRLRQPDGSTSVLTPPGCRYADGCARPDGRGLVCVREDHRAAGEATNTLVAVELDRTDDAGTLLYGVSDFVAAPSVSPDGLRVAFIAWNHPNMPWDETQLIVGDLGTPGVGGLGNIQMVAGRTGESVIEPRWDADGSLYFLSDRSGWWNLYRWRDGGVETVTSLAAELGAPLWQLGQRSYALTGDGHALLRVCRDAVDTLTLLDLASGALKPIDLPFVNFGSLGLLDARTALTLAVSIDDVPQLITIDLASGQYQTVRRAGQAPLPAAAISRPEAVVFPTHPGPDGEARSAHAWFYPPHLPGFAPVAGEAPPLMVLLHGGPTSHSAAALKVIVQFWTTRGFAVVDVNYGGSSGHGRAYRDRLRGQWGVVDLQDAVAAVDFLAASGRIDGARVAIRGGSAGGFTVLSALAFTSRFAAGINYYGVADLQTLAADTHKFESRYLDNLVAPLPEGLAVYRERSPVHHMASCRAALITLQGSDDKAVPPAQSRAIVQAARAAGCPVAYIEFEGEGHGFRQGQNIARGLQAEQVFLGRVFGYTPAGDLPPVEIANEEALAARP